MLAILPPRSTQVIARGRVSDAVAGTGLETATLSLSLAIGAGPFRPLAVRLARPGSGWFAFAIDPERGLPVFPAGTVRLRVDAGAAGHAAGSSETTIDAAAFARTAETRIIGGVAVDIGRIDAAPWDLSVALAPLPVALGGTVLIDGDADRPAAGASVAITAPVVTAPVVADAAGRFRIAALPVAARIDLAITRVGVTVDVVHRPDFGRPLNEAIFAV